MKTPIQKANFKLIEAELRGLKNNKALLDDLRLDIIEGIQMGGDRVQSSSINDITAQKGIRLASSTEIIEISKRIHAIEDSLTIIGKDELKLKLLKMKYFDNKYTDAGIISELIIDRATFYRWKNEIIRLIANRLGWKV